MNKYIKHFLFLIILFCLFYAFPTKALTHTEIAGRNECGTLPYEVGIANVDGTMTKNNCYANYDEAFNAMNNLGNDNAIIVSGGKVINAKYAFVDLDVSNEIADYKYTNYYTTSTSGTLAGYLNNSVTHGGVDGAFIERASNGRIKVRISNLTGWIDSNYYHIIPFNWINSNSYYKIDDGNIWHCYAKNIENSLAKPACRSYGPKPSMLNKGTYFSFDGIYFYSNPKLMIDDYRNGSNANAVNKNTPYYNYYQFLPHHTKTTYSSQNIDEYIRSTEGLKKIGYIYGSYAFPNYSTLYGQGTFLYNAQQRYGINAATILAITQNESGNGTSNISIDKNNGFGHGAADSDPYNGSKYYPTFANGIYIHAYTWMTYGYAEATDSRYNGSVFGDKGIGANINYASDPYWGEKAASFYYDFDTAMGLADYNYYQLAISTASGIYARKGPGTEHAVVYQYKESNIPVVIVGEEKDKNGVTWYKVMSDVNIDALGNAIPYDSVNYKTYNWDTNYVYVSSEYFKRINTAKTGLKNPNDVYDFKDNNYTYNIYSAVEAASGIEKSSPKAALVTKDAPLYYDSTLETLRGITLKAGRFTMVHAEALDENGNVVSYLVTSEYEKNQKEWVSKDNIKFVDKSIGYADFDQRALYQNIYSDPNGTIIGTIYDKTYLPLLDKKVVNGVTWIKIQYGLSSLTNNLGWIKESDTDYRMLYTKIVTNPPEIIANDISIPLNSSFDPKKYATATDKEDGDITSKIIITEINVNTGVAGTYKVTYSVTDSENNTTTKSINVVVKDYEDKKGLFVYNALKSVSNDKFEVSGFLAIAGMDNTKKDNISHKFILKNVDTNKEYALNLDNWTTGYPYEMSNIDDDKPYNYNGGWFKGIVDLKDIPQGDYIAYVEMTNSIYKTRMLYNNLVYGQMERKATGENGRGYLFQMNYYTKERPMDVSIRNDGLLGNSTPPTSEKIYNFFEKIDFIDNKLHIRGTSHNTGIDYGISKDIKREIVLEKIDDYSRVSKEVGSITDGNYVVELKVSDGKDKTRAWFDGSIDISTLEKGIYAIYIKTTVGDFTDFGELKDLAYKKFEDNIEINGKKYSLRRVNSKRFRMELIVQ